MGIEGRPQQDEVAVAGHDEINHRLVAVSRLQALAHQNPQIAGQRRVGIVDRLVLADQTAQPARDRAGAMLEGRILEDLVGLDRMRSRQREHESDESEEQAPHGSHSAGCGAANGAARRGAASRKRRSVSDSVPPMAITRAPIQMSRISGLS